jgi:IS1 family transposase
MGVLSVKRDTQSFPHIAIRLLVRKKHVGSNREWLTGQYNRVWDGQCWRSRKRPVELKNSCHGKRETTRIYNVKINPQCPGLRQPGSPVFYGNPLPQGSLHQDRSRFNRLKRAEGGANSKNSDQDQTEGEYQRQVVNPIPFHRHGGEFGDRYGFLCVCSFLLIGGSLTWRGAGILLDSNWRSRRGWFITVCGFIFWEVLGLGSGMIGCLPWDWYGCLTDGYEHSQNKRVPQGHGETVTQKLLTHSRFSYYNNYMANVLSTDKQVAIIGSLCERSSIRSIERITGVHRDTIMRLGVRVGQGCTALMDEKMRNLSCTRLEMDEIWGFIGKKDRNVRPHDDDQVGSVWTFCAIDADTKLVPSFKVGKRDNATANAFVRDVAGRMANRVQISMDGLRAYVEAIEASFGADVDYAQIVKTYGHVEASDNCRYSAPEFVSSEKTVIVGRPDTDLISTSYIERLNATTRLHMRRLTRLTLAFSKKRENFEAAVGLHFAYYNFVKRHNTLRCTPAMAAGVASGFWSVGDLVEATA